MYNCNCKNYPYCFEPQHHDELVLLLSTLKHMGESHGIELAHCPICGQSYKIEQLKMGTLVTKHQNPHTVCF